MYESGLLVALLLWITHIINCLISINSLKEKNLNKIGQRLSWVTLKPKPMTPADQRRTIIGSSFKFIAVALISLPFTLLSWLQAILILSPLAYQFMKDRGAPQAVKEFRWKMKNRDMNLEQIIIESLKSTEQEISDIEQAKSEIIQSMKDRGLDIYYS